MPHLPSPERQELLLTRLATLIRQRGCGPWVNAPLLTPDDRWFPDRWTPDAAGARVVLRRLMRYAGLDRLDLHLQVVQRRGKVQALDAYGRPSQTWHSGAIGWFAGIDELGKCHFGLDASQVVDPEALVGTLAHEVAHAYRRHHALEAPDQGVEEELTDLTTVFLGFGLFTTNGSYRYRASGLDGDALAGVQWSHQQAGYLPPEDFSFLLAAQTVSRDAAPAQVKALAASLEPNQRAFFKTARKHLGRDRQALLDRLGVPPRDGWPPPPDLARLTRPQESSEPARPAPTSARPAINQGMPVFRVPTHRGDVIGPFGAVAGLVAALVAGLGGLAALAVIGASWLGARGAGRALTLRDECSDPDCAEVIPAGAEVCPACGGLVAGSIRSRNDRLEAEEDWLARQGPAIELEARSEDVVG